MRSSGQTWPEERIVSAARDGDAASIAALVSGAHPHIRRFAFTLCESEQDAEDAAQEAMIVLFRKIGSLRATAALASWVFRILRNECLRRARAVVSRNGLDEVAAQAPLAQSAQSAQSAPSAEDDLLTRLEVERVAAAVAELPVVQRRVLIMRDVQGLPGRDVARVTGLSVAAMKSQLHRARLAVRARLEAGEETP